MVMFNNLSRLVHENLTTLQFFVRFWIYIFNNQLEKGKTTLLPFSPDLP